MFPVPFSQRIVGLWGGSTRTWEDKSLTEKAREAPCSCQHWPLSSWVFVHRVRTAGGSPPPFFVSAGVRLRRRYLTTVPRTRRKSSHFPESLIPSHCTYEMFACQKRNWSLGEMNEVQLFWNLVGHCEKSMILEEWMVWIGPPVAGFHTPRTDDLQL